VDTTDMRKMVFHGTTEATEAHAGEQGGGGQVGADRESASAGTVVGRGSTFVVAGASFGSGADFDPGAGTQILDGDLRFLSRFSF
jgi:hypothetical protein